MAGNQPYDVVIVGAGVVGCAIARRLSLTTARVAVVEAAHDVGEGASKGNTGIATCGADCTPGTLEAELVTRSSPGWEALCESLDTPWERIGTLCVATTPDEQASLGHLLEQARANGCRAEIVTGEAARGMEPQITEQARAALHIPDDGIVDSLRLAIGYAELAARNGVAFHFGAPAVGFEVDGDQITHVRAGRLRLAARHVVNAAGVESDTVSRLAGGEEFRCWPRQGQYWLLDRELGARFRKVVGGVPTEHTRGIYCVPTTNRSLLLGPTADDRTDRGDRSVDSGTLEHVLDAARRLVPSVDRRFAIKTFSANRPASDSTYRIAVDARHPNLVHAAGIRSTGVSGSPAIAEHVYGLLAEAGARVECERTAASVRLEPVPRLLHHSQPERLYAADHRYGQVVCACEQVTAAEIAAAFSMSLPPRSVDALRKRTRATGGRCQGAVCMAGVSFLCSLHGGWRPWQLPQSEPQATIGVGPARG
ncbi:MAG: NAD(P)/FAD-dependent oxidoreductase [Gaiellales bacterium]